MSGVSLIGVGIYLVSHGLRGLPNQSIFGCVGMIVGGIVVIVGVLV